MIDCEGLSLRNKIDHYYEEITRILGGELGRDVLNDGQMRAFKRQGVFRNHYLGGGTQLVLTTTAKKIYDGLKEERAAIEMPCPGDCDVCYKKGCVERRGEPDE